ncbi:hypothetical protein DFH09DRAFT_1187479 [Mycena vulgaris]|nr:hypothetical protein DFH09DRAFT_1187479 [Mycena vulgaris]
MASSPDVVKTGWVSVKEDGLLARWSHKWFHLGEGILALQRSPPFRLLDPTQSVILLNDVINIERTDLKPYCLLLETHRKRFFLSLKNDNDLYDWYDSIYCLSSFNRVSNPTNFIHMLHVGVDPVTKRLKNMPDKWLKLFERHSVPTREDIAKDPLLASDVLDIYKEWNLKELEHATLDDVAWREASSPYSAQDVEDVLKFYTDWEPGRNIDSGTKLGPGETKLSSPMADSSVLTVKQKSLPPVVDRPSISPLPVKTKKTPSAAQTKHIINSPDDTSATPRDSTSPVDIILYNHEQRASLLKQGLSPVDLRNALQACYQHIYSALLTVLDSRDTKHMVLLLEGDRAQSFLDAVQDVLDKGSLPSAQHTSQARRLIVRLSEACDKLPSSLFITGIVDHDEHPTFIGGFGDIYRASHNSNTVAVKRIRMFSATPDSQRSRLVR